MVLELAEHNAPGGKVENYGFSKAFSNIEEPDTAHKFLLCDAQTSGGLLIACPETELDGLLATMSEKGEQPAIIGRITERGGHLVTIV